MLDFITIDVGCGVKQDDTVSVVNNFVLDDPCKSTFDYKDTFSSTFSNLILDYDSVGASRPTKRQVGLVVLRDQVLFNVSIC